jgi:hypothetical protein
MPLDKVSLSRELKKFVRSTRKNQKELAVEITKQQSVRFDQSQISRTVNGRYSGEPETLKALCKYASIDIKAFETEDIKPWPLPLTNVELCSAVNEAWDRTPRGAKMLSQLILAVGKATSLYR